ncbi:hypothetical protein O7632_10765 [Solwaraspora sp. WMMD406]|uniref:hypothetical protein n=1 Tax=Solwaraspora sp. WMMD406 TaxID=3016095 RepID=UPI0024167226|nr:hypothetical protein [Solwaraspora sp. WMMD406]MDG4764580.1 hypothetical protein [Solwaraspora sp. WMMD406]
MLVDIDSDYWDLPVLREAIAARVWGSHDSSRYRVESRTGQAAGLPAPQQPVVPAARTGGGRHRRPTPVG